MATLKKPLISAAALVSAAAVAVATPAIMPSIAAPSPTALSTAKVNLATFADLLSITPEDISNAYFGGWGFALKPFDDTDPDPDWAAAYLNPFVNCNEDCSVAGLSGVAYLLTDALINGNGGGYEDSANWSTSALNYFFEGGFGIGLTYLYVQPFANQDSPLYNPALASALTFASQGTIALTQIYIQVLDTVSKLAQTVPFVGPYVYGAIQAYLGPNTSDEFFGDYGYAAGLSGLLRYVTDVVLTGGNPYPPYGPPVTEPAREAASVLAVAEVPAASGTPAADAPESTPAAEAPESTPAVDAPESTPAVDAPEATPAVEDTPAETTPAVDAPESTPAAPELDVPAAEVADSAPAEARVRAPKRPIRDAVEKVSKQIGSAIGGSRAAKAGAATAGAADTGAE